MTEAPFGDRWQTGAVADVPETRYAKTRDGVHVAYEVFGEGPFDLVFANSWASHAEFSWSNPTIARFYERLSSFCRLVLFDKRGTGSSDPMVSVPTMEDRMDDIRAVMDAVGIERAALLGGSEGAATCAVFAATYPERTSALVMFSPFIVGVADDECPWAWTWEVWELVKEAMAAPTWGTSHGSGVEYVVPSLSGNETAMEWYGRYFRVACSPALAIALLAVNTEIDIRPVLATIRVPTLVLHRIDETWVNVNYGRYAAAKIDGARLVELEGTDHYPWEQDAEAVLGEIQEFLTGERSEPDDYRVLATVLFTDIVESTALAARSGDRSWRELLDAHDAMVRRQLTRFAGQEIKTTGDGFLATFDGPARAIRSALAIQEGGARLGLDIRAGLHTGEIERRGADVGGVAVHLGQRVCATAGAREVVVSSTVKDLVVGSGIEFEDRGEHELKGVPGQWHLFAVSDTNKRGRPGFGWQSLTPAELEVVRLVAQHLSNPAIADRLVVSRATVKTHLIHVFNKLGVTSRSELAVVALRHGMEMPPLET
jgi:pimeloyl-ACP methyl ester carboxylesterase/DNA-binding CsgD family transcriptional regulator